MVTIGIPTYNRLRLLKRMAQSFYASISQCTYSIRVFDDDSTDYTIETLKQIFPDAVSVHSQKSNIGADANMIYMYRSFIESTNDDVFFNADSDLIFSNGWLERGVAILRKTDGILSVYNTPDHQSICETEVLCEKENLGAAGTFFSREALKYLFDNMKETQLVSLPSVGADYGWSKFFKAHGFHLYCTKESYVQHIGFEGYNGTLDRINYGKNFTVDSVVNGQILNDTLYDSSIKQKKSVRRSYALFPFELIPKNARVVLYGYANTGKDFEEQIKRSEYCKLVTIIDENKFNDVTVRRPQILSELDFDYLILATIYDDVADDMKKTVKSIAPSVVPKIIYKKNNGIIRL